MHWSPIARSDVYSRNSLVLRPLATPFHLETHWISAPDLR
jgi:hypothetical protein